MFGKMYYFERGQPSTSTVWTTEENKCLTLLQEETQSTVFHKSTLFGNTSQQIDYTLRSSVLRSKQDRKPEQAMC